MNEANPVSILRAPASPRKALHLIALLSLCAASALAEWRISAISVQPKNPDPPNDGSGYRVVVTNAGSGVERRCYRDGHHFLSILNENGIFALRPHPGVDLNGWGSTLYLQPFLPGADLRSSVISLCQTGPGGIQVAATGLVSRGTLDQYGTWDTSMTFQYDRLAKQMSATGQYTIRLAGVLGPATGDLNLAKLASNYLDDVPLVDGTTNDTGDMAHAHVVAGHLNTIWNPSEQPRYFPNDQTSNLLINVSGAFNQVDTAAQGHHAIQAAFKPSLKLTLTSETPEIPMIFGGLYDTSKAQDFSADNVGITPLVLTSSTSTQFQFTIAIESAALPGDGLGILCNLAATGALPATTAEVFYTESLSSPFRRYVGDLGIFSASACTGTVAIPFPPDVPVPRTGFLRLMVITDGFTGT
jgi:hypothetical protein